MATIPFIGQAYAGRSPEVNAQECINLFLEGDPAEGKASAALYGTPGMTRFTTLNVGKEVRALYACGLHLYAVCGSGFYKVTKAGVVTLIGTINSSSGPVSMEDNGSQIMLADGADGWIYTLDTSTLVQITDADFPGAGTVDYLDGYFIFNKPDSAQFFITSLYDGTIVDGLDFASAESSPDKLVSLIVDHRELYLLGEKTVEVWYNSGDSSFPFDRNNNAQVEIGLAAANSVVSMDNTIVFLSDRGTVIRLSGYSPQIISTRAIEYQISKEDISSARAFSYTHEGHNFYVLTFPAGRTWVYDAATGAWHSRKSFGTPRWRANCHAVFDGRHIVGDFSTGRLYVLDMDVYTEDGMPIERIRVSQPIHAEEKTLFMSELEIDFDGGMGPLTGQGAAPQACLQWSDNGGRSWSQELWTNIGSQGAYGAQAIWRRLGSFRHRIFKLTVTDPVPVIIIGAYGSVESGSY